MIELGSTPIIILVILGSVGVALPVVSIALKERPSMISYGIATPANASRKSLILKML